jgi:transglutaminase-like putative cysteine protease
MSQKPGQRSSPPLPEQTLKQSYAGALVICAALFLVEDISPWLSSILALACAVGWQLDKYKKTLLSESVWRLCSLTLLGYILLLGWRISGITVANTHLLLYLMLHRLLSPKGPAELRQMFLILFIGFFLISGQTISLWYFPIFLLYVGFAGFWLMLTQYESWPIKAPPVQALAMILLACLGASGLAFAATPRLEPLRRMNPLQAMVFDKRRVASQAVVAFNENVSLGFFGQLKKSGARALRIKPVVPATRPALKLYVRGNAFDHFNGRTWKKSRIDFRYRMGTRIYWSAQGRAWMPRQSSRWIAPGNPQEQKTWVLEFNVFPMNSTVLFTAQTLRELEQTQFDNAVYFDYTDTLYFHAPYSLGTQYRISANAEALGYSAYILDYEVLRTKFLQLPDQNLKIRELAYKITRNERSVLDKIKAVERYLHKGYAYSSFSHNPNLGLSEFLFSVRKGNCEYFATAAAVLLRHVGIPSRLVTGFLADEWNEFGSFFDVRQGQAHAWTEAYVEGMGWVALDATPPQGVFTTQAGEIFQQFRRYFDAAQLRWYRNIIGYDNFLQKNTFYRFQLSWKKQDIRRWVYPGFWGILALSGFWIFRAVGKRLVSRLRRKPAGHFELALQVLARLGFHRAPHKTAREFALTVAEIRPELAAVTELVELHYKERYSSQGLEPAEKLRAEELLEEIYSRTSQ